MQVKNTRRQAIVTRYLGPTNHRGARVEATAYAGSITVPYDYSLGIEENHDAAAMALCAKLGWTEGTLVGGGGLPMHGNAYVFAPGDGQ